jgi:4-aminobutyrate--pyruvate transaminase
LIITEAQIDEMLEAFDKALADTMAWVTAEGLMAA